MIKRPLRLLVACPSPLLPESNTFKRQKPCTSPASTQQHISRVLPFLCVGSEQVSQQDLLQHGVTAVIDCRNASEQDSKGPIHDAIALHRLSIPLMDNNAEDASKYFYCAIKFIETVRRDGDNGGMVFVHCTMGISRSCAIVCAYLIWHQQIGYRDSLQLLKQTRPSACPNMSFSLQLVEFSQQQERKILAFEVSMDGKAITEILDKASVESIVNNDGGVLLLVDKSKHRQYVWCKRPSCCAAARTALQTLVELNAAKCALHTYEAASHRTEFQETIGLLASDNNNLQM